MTTSAARPEGPWHKVTPVMLDAHGQQIACGDHITPATGLALLGGGLRAQVMELTNPREIRVRWLGLRLDEPCYVDPGRVVVVPRPA